MIYQFVSFLHDTHIEKPNSVFHQAYPSIPTTQTGSCFDELTWYVGMAFNRPILPLFTLRTGGLFNWRMDDMEYVRKKDFGVGETNQARQMFIITYVFELTFRLAIGVEDDSFFPKKSLLDY